MTGNLSENLIAMFVSAGLHAPALTISGSFMLLARSFKNNQIAVCWKDQKLPWWPQRISRVGIISRSHRTDFALLGVGLVRGHTDRRYAHHPYIMVWETYFWYFVSFQWFRQNQHLRGGQWARLHFGFEPCPSFGIQISRLERVSSRRLGKRFSQFMGCKWPPYTPPYVANWWRFHGEKWRGFGHMFKPDQGKGIDHAQQDWSEFSSKCQFLNLYVRILRPWIIQPEDNVNEIASLKATTRLVVIDTVWGHMGMSSVFIKLPFSLTGLCQLEQEQTRPTTNS